MMGQEEISTSNSHFDQGSIIFVMYIANSKATNRKVKKWNKTRKGAQIICWERRKNRIITCSNKTTKVREIVKTGTIINGNKKKTVTNMVDINSIISVITLNVSGLNIPFKRQRFRVHKNTCANSKLSIRNPL